MEVVQRRSRSASGANPNVYRVSSNSSRLGVRGTESLGGGLNAIFQIESSVSADAGGGTLAARETFVGLQGAWGTVKMGNFLAPYDDIHPIFGNVPTLTTSILSTAAVWAHGGYSKANGGFDARARQLGPLRLAELRRLHRRHPVRVVARHGGRRSKRTPASCSLGGFYNNGPIQVGVAYEQNNNDSRRRT